MSRQIAVTTLAARRFARRAVGRDIPVPDAGAALAHLGYVQIDPINVCGRMHDLILRNRVENYQVGVLMRHLHGEGDILPAAARTAFGHHLPDTSVLCACPLDAWPHLLAAMRLRTQRESAWSGRLTQSELKLEKPLLEEIRIRGPLVLASHRGQDQQFPRRVGDRDAGKIDSPEVVLPRSVVDRRTRGQLPPLRSPGARPAFPDSRGKRTSEGRNLPLACHDKTPPASSNCPQA
jgi:hypothetical protein